MFCANVQSHGSFPRFVPEPRLSVQNFATVTSAPYNTAFCTFAQSRLHIFHQEPGKVRLENRSRCVWWCVPPRVVEIVGLFGVDSSGDFHQQDFGEEDLAWLRRFSEKKVRFCLPPNAKLCAGLA